jgi:hypothetical protein
MGVEGTAGMTTAIEIVKSLVLEDGQKWGQLAREFQLADAEAILGDNGKPYNFLTRGKGASKTTDIAAIATALLLMAEARTQSYWIAVDRDQGKLAVESIRGFVDRTSGLSEALLVTADSAEAVSSGARLTVMASDAPSSHGWRPAALYVDEMCRWPDTAGPQELWDSISAGAAKRSDSRMIVLTSAGDPSHWSGRVIDHARKSKLWRVAEVPGVCPWLDPERVEEQRQRLMPSTFRQLFLNEWCSGEDKLASREDIEACAVLDGPLEPNTRQFRYCLALDVGLTRDRTAVTVCHREGDRTIVLDRLAVWAGSHESPVLLQEVEDWIVKAATNYRCRCICDPYQAVGLMQRLTSHRLAAEKFTFSQSSVGRLASTLFRLIRDKDLRLPRDAELIDELAHVRLHETSPGTYRMDASSGHFDDRVLSLAMSAYTLLNEPQAPVGYSEEIAAINAGMRDANRRRGTTTEEIFSGQVETEQVFGERRRGGWRSRLDPDLPTLR